MNFLAWSKSDYLVTRAAPGVGWTFQQQLPSAGNYTVQFRVSAQTSLTPNSGVGNITPTAKIAWSIGGNVVQRIISVYDGASLTGVGDHVRVDITDQTIDDGDLPFQKYLVAVTVSEGVRASNKQPPTYTQYLSDGQVSRFGRVDVSGGASVDIPVPLDAGVISVFVTATGHTGSDHETPVVLTEAEVSVEQLSFGDVILRQYDPRDYDWVPLSPQCSKIRLRNSMPSTDNNEILFGVTFGIDG
jgi:hypothetical protein